MALSLTRSFVYSSGAVITSSQNNTNENTLYNAFSGLEAKTSTISNIVVDTLIKSTGTFEAVAGTASAPGYTTTGDTNTGLFFSAADTLDLTTGGTSRFTLATTTLTTTLPFRSAAGSETVPTYSYSGDIDSGMYSSGANSVGITCGGTRRVDIDATVLSTTLLLRTGAGTAAAPSHSFSGETDCGMYSSGTNTVGIAVAGARVMDFSATNIAPTGGGDISSGDGTSFWNDISYKTLTDRGCLPWCDDLIEMPDGSKVTDVEAISLLKKHPTKLTVHGVPMLDYTSFPKLAYRKADNNGVELPRDDKGEPIGGFDGVEMTFMFGVIMGAIKELNARVKVLEAA